MQPLTWQRGGHHHPPEPCRFCRPPCHFLPDHCRFLPLLPPRTRNVKWSRPAKPLEFGNGAENVSDTPSQSGKNGNVDHPSQLCRTPPSRLTPFRLNASCWAFTPVVPYAGHSWPRWLPAARMPTRSANRASSSPRRQHGDIVGQHVAARRNAVEAEALVEGMGACVRLLRVEHDLPDTPPLEVAHRLRHQPRAHPCALHARMYRDAHQVARPRVHRVELVAADALLILGHD